MKARLGAIRACFELEKSEHGLRDQALVRVTWRIDPQGAVHDARVAENDSGSARLARCVVRRIEEMHFPASEGTTNTSYPFLYVGNTPPFGTTRAP